MNFWLYIPFVGLVRSAFLLDRAQRAHAACIEAARNLPPVPEVRCWTQYQATWPLWDQFNTAMVSTMVFLFAALLVCFVGRQYWLWRLGKLQGMR